MAHSPVSGVFCVGIATLDYVYGLDAIPASAEKYRAKDLSVVGGGLAANASVAVARLGGHAWLATRLGDDLTGATIVAELAAEGVKTDHCRRFPGLRSPVSAILVDKAGERLIVSYSEPQMPVDPSWLPRTLPEGAGAVLGDTRWDDGAAAMFRVARAAGLPAVLDGDRAPAHPDVLGLATHVAFSEQGIQEVTGIPDSRAALVHLGRTASNWVAVTMGAKGVLCFRDGVIHHVPGFVVEAVDTLAAGDVWHGAFALALAEGQSELPAIRFASATAALKCTRFGGRKGTPARAEVEQFLRERG
jgi:sulfofructose kinase